ncbi:MAG: nucleotide exchange factor GrpE [Deltaproteobacteria bacterium]|nr:nucleotide exchange factor GrpE [Deltaproteobacteria bacterium]
MSYITRLVDALLGREPPVIVTTEATVNARLAALEMDLRARDQRIVTMQKEYATLEATAKRATTGAGQEQIGELFKKLAAPLANFSLLAAHADTGQSLEAADVTRLFRSVEKHLHAAGLEQVGSAGEHVPFDVAFHQRMSGGMVSAGSPVVVRMPGYRYQGKVLLKAMVTAKETTEKTEDKE